MCWLNKSLLYFELREEHPTFYQTTRSLYKNCFLEDLPRPYYNRYVSHIISKKLILHLCTWWTKTFDMYAECKGLVAFKKTHNLVFPCFQSNLSNIIMLTCVTAQSSIAPVKWGRQASKLALALATGFTALLCAYFCLERLVIMTRHLRFKSIPFDWIISNWFRRTVGLWSWTDLH